MSLFDRLVSQALQSRPSLLPDNERLRLGMAWFLLIVAGLFETCWAVGLKYTQGFTRLWPSLFVVVTMSVSLVLLGVAVKTLPISTAYAVWVGIGAFGAAVFGVLLLGETMTFARAFFLCLLLVSIIGLKIASGKP